RRRTRGTGLRRPARFHSAAARSGSATGPQGSASDIRHWDQQGRALRPTAAGGSREVAFGHGGPWVATRSFETFGVVANLLTRPGSAGSGRAAFKSSIP